MTVPKAEVALAMRRVGNYVMRNRRVILSRVRDLASGDLEECLHAAVAKGCRILAEAVDAEALEASTVKMLKNNYWVTATANTAYDRGAAKDRPAGDDLDLLAELRPPRDLGPAVWPDPVADSVGDALAKADASVALQNALVVLYERGRRGPDAGPLAHPHLSPSDWEVLRTLHAVTDESGRVWGAQTETARRLGKTRSTVNEQVARIRTLLALTRYVSGVLSRARTLLDPHELDHSLSVYSGWLPDGSTADLMADAAQAVRTYRDSGTRARPDLLPPLPQDAAAARTTALHDAEGSYARAVGNDHPNCVLICPAHTVHPDNVTEF